MEKPNQNNPDAPTVTVVIPLYNKGKYILRALASVMDQTFPPLEIIVVDDGSVDDGREKVESLIFTNRKIRLLRQKNSGPGSARNAGLAAASGKYIAFLDADDEWLPTFLEKAIAVLENRAVNAILVFSDYFYSPGFRRNDTGQFEELDSVIEIAGDTDVNIIRKLIGFHCTCFALMRTDAVKKWGGFFDKYRCRYGEDVYVFLKLMFNGRIAIIREPLGIYHTEASGLYKGGDIPIENYPPPPYLQNPQDILDSCPPSKLPAMKKNFSVQAIKLAECFAKWGKKKKAQELLDRFTGDEFPSIKGVSRVRFLVKVAPLLPLARRIRRAMISLVDRVSGFKVAASGTPNLKSAPNAGRTPTYPESN
jgi:glycosyltransferase involved in cell wall biosynthesis